MQHLIFMLISSLWIGFGIAFAFEQPLASKKWYFIILEILFFILFAPVGIFYRLTNKNK